jgi:acetyl esterase/lipase
MSKSICSLLVILSLSLTSFAQTKFILPLWPNGAKESNGITEPEKIENETRLTNISEAAVTVYLPKQSKATGAAVVVCPGGGYRREAILHEGSQVAEWFNEKGIAAILLKYRLPNGHYNIPLSDAQRAIRLVRANASKWRIDTSKVAIAGFSAGGHLASTAGTHFDNGNSLASDSIEHYSSRPNMMILFYPVISMKKELTHPGSRKNLLGEKPLDELVTQFSSELQVKNNTPPTILLLSDDDKVVSPLNSIQFYSALKAKNIPASLHIFPTGGHGWGMRSDIIFWQEWRTLLLEWFSNYQYIK